MQYRRFQAVSYTHLYLYSAHEFRNRYEMPLVKDGDKMTADSFRARIKPFMLRRMKSDVLNELPEKIENTMYAELTGEQKKMYTSYLALAKNQTLALLGDCLLYTSAIKKTEWHGSASFLILVSAVYWRCLLYTSRVEKKRKDEQYGKI